MGTLKKITVTTVTVTGRLVIIHLNSRLSIRYDILKATRSLCLTLEKAQNVSNSCSHRPQKTCTNPSFRCFFPLLARISAAQNFSIPTAVGRNFAVKWPILWPKVVVTRVKAKNSGGEEITTVLMPSMGRGDRLHGGIAMPAIPRTRHQHDPYQASAQPLTGIVTNAPPILQTQRWQSGLALCVLCVSVSLC